jgi:hypothetical protein
MLSSPIQVKFDGSFRTKHSQSSTGEASNLFLLTTSKDTIRGEKGETYCSQVIPSIKNCHHKALSDVSGEYVGTVWQQNTL